VAVIEAVIVVCLSVLVTVSDPARLKQVAQEVKNLNYRSTPRSTHGYLGRYVRGRRELKTHITREAIENSDQLERCGNC
jgi:hypothetical protein